MKNVILSVAMLLILGSNTTATAQRHRHTQRTETVATTPGNANQQQPAAKTQSQAAADDEGIEAFSDTTTVCDADSLAAAGNKGTNASDKYNPSNYDDPFSWLAAIGTTSFFGIMMAIFIVILVLLFCFSPLIIVILVIRYLVRRHNDNVRLMEMAMEKSKEDGTPLPDEQMPLSRKSPAYMWRRGVRNVSTGLGLMLFFWFLGAEPLVGIGGLVACIGVGQMFMVRHNYDNKHNFDRKRGDDLEKW